MAEQPPLSGAGPPRSRARHRLFVVLALFVLTGAAIAVAVALAVSRTGHKAPVPAVAPPVKTFRIVFPEGFTRAQMAQRVADVARIADREHHGRVKLSATTYLAASRRARVPCFAATVQTNLEGLLFPATYDFLVATTSRQLVQEQLVAFCRNWKSVGLAYAKSKNLTPHDVLTIASMIEKEAAVPAERPLISAVIYNRLHIRQPLGIDAALRYGLHIPPTQSILESQLRNPTPYNTRLHAGLPPTPIANPGLPSLRAAAHPAHVDYLYFVRKPDHRHNFFTNSSTVFNQYLCAHGYGC
jgi:UPF0755 protein